jgi:hypothetical protein
MSFNVILRAGVLSCFKRPASIQLLTENNNLITVMSNFLNFRSQEVL